MKRVDPLFAYLSVLAVIQPARIQDIENNAASLLGGELSAWLLEKGLLREAHEDARSNGMVIPVRRGVYFMTPKGKHNDGGTNDLRVGIAFSSFAVSASRCSGLV